MKRILHTFGFDGITTDSMGHYLAGLGLLSATSKQWPKIRACWRQGRFLLLSDQISELTVIKDYLLNKWKPAPYERWWSNAQKRDTKAESSVNLRKERNRRTLEEVKLLDAHIVGIGRNCFNPVLGTGGNIGRRDLAKVWQNSIKLITKPERDNWLDAALMGHANCSIPELKSGGTWFVFANKMYNSGQGWHREGRLSPWSFLLALEGARMLVGGVNRRFGSRAVPYAVFPFISEPSQPVTDGEIGVSCGEFWAPLWKNPATLGEVETLFKRGQAKLRGRAARAPYEFAVAALAAGVDAGVAEFVRYELRQTTSSNVFEAIPREHIQIISEPTSVAESNNRSIASKLLLTLIETNWLERLPIAGKQKRKHVGIRGKVEKAIVALGAIPDESERWRQLLLKLANAQTRIDRNQALRQKCMALPLLDPAWFDFAWPEAEGIPAEVEMARAIASIGWPRDAKTGDLPLLANIFSVNFKGSNQSPNVHFPKNRPAQAVWGYGTPLQLLLDVGHRRLIDANNTHAKPFAAACLCSPDIVHRLLRSDDSIDLENVIQWIPALSLINWSKSKYIKVSCLSSNEPAVEYDGTVFLQCLARPFFQGCPSVFPLKLEPTAALCRRIFNLLRFNAFDEAIHVMRERYLAAGRDIVMPPSGLEADGELIAASLLIPIPDRAVINGIHRWLKPRKRSRS